MHVRLLRLQPSAKRTLRRQGGTRTVRAASVETARGRMRPKPETLATTLTCTECGRRPLPGERWSLRFAELGEVAVYCPDCDRREFSDDDD